VQERNEQNNFLIGRIQRKELDSHVLRAPESGRPSAPAYAPIWDQERLQRGEMAAKAGPSAKLTGSDRKPATGFPPMLYRVRLREFRES